MKLLLFDIDGTLLDAQGTGRRAVEAALSRLVGQPISTAGVSFSGKTDRQILREVLTASAVEPGWLDGRFEDAVDAFVAEVRRSFHPEHVRALPGATDLVERLHARSDVQLGLLTGNLREMAYLKLSAIGLDERHFPFGAFGCDDEDRNALPAVAAARAERHTGRRFAGRDLVVIGDTPRDIACARAADGFVVAVATGRFTRDELAACEPDALLDGLEDAEAFLAQVL